MKVVTNGLLQGVDFFFSNRSHALKFVDFVQSVVPANCRDDKQLVSHNEHTATYNYKYTFSVEIVPICRVRCALTRHAKCARQCMGAEWMLKEQAFVVALIHA